MKMKTALTVLAAAAAVFAQGAFAQASAPASRAEIKAETAAAEKAGKLTPAGEGPGNLTKAPSTSSDTTRAARKAKTLEDRKDGDLIPAGPATGGKQLRAEEAKPSTKTRAERKAETLKDEKEGKLIPAGEGPGSPKK